MADTERILGRLEQSQLHVEKSLDEMDRRNHARFKHLEAKVDLLNRFYWKIAGGSAVAGMFAGLIGMFINKLF